MLRDRSWHGDDLLAQQLVAALGEPAVSTLKPLPLDLDDLADILEGDPVQGGGRVDLRTNEVWHQATIDYAREVGEEDEDDSDDDEHWLWVHCEGSSAAFRDMEMFAGTITDTQRAERLLEALEARGPFRRFRDVLARWPEDLTRWHQFSDERRRGRSREWLAGAGYQATPPTKSEPRDAEPA